MRYLVFVITLLLISCQQLVAEESDYFYLDVRYAGPVGKGIKDNQFIMGPGINWGFQMFEDGSGVKVGIGFHQMKNRVGSSTISGTYWTPLYFEIYTGTSVESYSFYWLAGFCWDWMAFDGMSGQDLQFSIPLGFYFPIDIGDDEYYITTKFRHIFINDLGQDKALELAFTLSY